MIETLSGRGRKLIDSPPTAKYILHHLEVRGDAWDADTNPDGYIPLCVAENKLTWDLLEPRIARCRDLEHHSLSYDRMIGNRSLRQELADFMGRTFIGRPIREDRLAVLNGAGSVLELLFYVIADPGDGVLVPTPSYTGFWSDLETRDELGIIPVHCPSDDGFVLTTELLDAAMAAADRPVRALLYTNPNNPLGRVDDPAQVETVMAWAERNGIHIVLDEIYALSVFGDIEFTSGAYLRPDLGDLLHIVWAFSKDFAMSGLRSGVLYTENADVHRAVEGLAMWACVSGDTQSMLRQLLADESWVDGYLEENRHRLAAAYRSVTAVLDRHDVPYFPSDAGFFFVVDMREFMDDNTWEAEDRMWARLVDEYRVNVTPGSACHNGEPGFMRLVFSCLPTAGAIEGAERIGRFAEAVRADRA